MNENNEMKNVNRKAMPKFILIMVISGIVGCLAGFFSAIYGLDRFSDSLKAAGELFETHIAPWMMLLTAVIVPVVSVPIYNGAKKLLTSWDGEDEGVSDAVDKKLSIVIWITSIALILSFFLIAATYSGGFTAFDEEQNTALIFISLVAFIVIMAESVFFQQKCVDTARKTNPEKKVSVYDLKFQKKWMDSCDEAERTMIGKCAFKAYSATNKACLSLAVLLAVGTLVFDFGFLPSLVVCIIWVVNQSIYCKESIRFSKAGNKIS